jgi:PIN domain nuclease of toxin-antitoxin system
LKLLLDTHIWIWSLLEPDRLTSAVAKELESPDNELWLSPISIWELLILVEKKRVILNTNVYEWIATALQTVPINEAPVNIEVALSSRRLNLSHEDPADRFIAATAQVYGLTLVTADGHLLDLKEISLLSNR